MGNSGRRGVLALVAAAAVVVGVAGCQDDDGGAKKAAAGPSASKPASDASDTTPAKALDTAFQKVSDAKSVKMHMTVTAPASAATSGAAGASTTVQAEGVMGWNPTVADLSMSGDAFGAAQGMPSKIREVMVGTTMYMDMGADAAKEMDGKRWMKLDLAAAAKAAGNPAAADQLAGSLQNTNQDPSQQMGLLLKSPDISHVGSEQVDGVKTEHYRGALTLDQIMAQGATKGLSAADSAKLKATMEKQGLKSEDIDVWIGADSLPVRVSVAMDLTAGPTKVDIHYSDYAATAPKVQAPPAGETFDLAEMLKQVQAEGAAG